jgi:hypothetical protein
VAVRPYRKENGNYLAIGENDHRREN